MTWKTPAYAIMEPEKAIRWWISEHFEAAFDNRDATWAADLYASYLDAAVETRSMPLVASPFFGRMLGRTIRRSPYVSETVMGSRRGGKRYLVKPKEGIVLVSAGQSAHGSHRLAEIFRDAKLAAPDLEWSAVQWKRQLEDDTRQLVAWLHIAGYRPNREGIWKSCGSLYAAVQPLGCRWTYQRFVDTIQRATTVKRGEGGARLVAAVEATEESKHEIDR